MLCLKLTNGPCSPSSLPRRNSARPGAREGWRRPPRAKGTVLAGAASRRPPAVTFRRRAAAQPPGASPAQPRRGGPSARAARPALTPRGRGQDLGAFRQQEPRRQQRQKQRGRPCATGARGARHAGRCAAPWAWHRMEGELQAAGPEGGVPSPTGSQPRVWPGFFSPPLLGPLIAIGAHLFGPA